MVHEVLERFWDEVKTQDALRKMTADERDEVLDWCITKRLKQNGRSRAATAWDAAYLEVQRARLRRLLAAVAGAGVGAALPFEVRLSEKEFKRCAGWTAAVECSRWIASMRSTAERC